MPSDLSQNHAGLTFPSNQENMLPRIEPSSNLENVVDPVYDSVFKDDDDKATFATNQVVPPHSDNPNEERINSNYQESDKLFQEVFAVTNANGLIFESNQEIQNTLFQLDESKKQSIDTNIEDQTDIYDLGSSHEDHHFQDPINHCSSFEDKLYNEHFGDNYINPDDSNIEDESTIPFHRNDFGASHEDRDSISLSSSFEDNLYDELYGDDDVQVNKYYNYKLT